jgi:hypothetical protein
MQKHWTCIVNTAPRKQPTLAKCLGSLAAAGWEPVVFAEPGSVMTEHATHWNGQRLGVWQNWLKACRWALDETSADLILTAQDDIRIHPDSKAFIESIDWPKNAAFVSLYTPKHYTIRTWDGTFRPRGVNAIKTRSLWGACAIVWRREQLAKVLQHKIAHRWNGVPPRSSSRESVMQARRDNPALIANSDTAIGRICNAMRLKMYFVDPSPAEHIAIHSAIGHGGNRGRRNAIRIADPSQPLWPQVFPQSNPVTIPAIDASRPEKRGTFFATP